MRDRWLHRGAAKKNAREVLAASALKRSLKHGHPSPSAKLCAVVRWRAVRSEPPPLDDNYAKATCHDSRLHGCRRPCARRSPGTQSALAKRPGHDREADQGVACRPNCRRHHRSAGWMILRMLSRSPRRLIDAAARSAHHCPRSPYAFRVITWHRLPASTSAGFFLSTKRRGGIIRGLRSEP